MTFNKLLVTYFSFYWFINGALSKLPIHLDRKGRYWLMHSATNLMVTACHAKDVVKTLQNPCDAALGPQPALEPLAAVTALHAFHALSAKSLHYTDWLHHAIMIGFVAPLGFMIKGSSLLGFNMFFTTGLPGFVDYSLLVACRMGYMKYATERKYNAIINTWLRAPGCVAHAVMCLVAYARVREGKVIQGNSLPSKWNGIACLVLAAASYWNGMFFQQRVVSSAARLTKK